MFAVALLLALFLAGCENLKTRNEPTHPVKQGRGQPGATQVPQSPSQTGQSQTSPTPVLQPGVQSELPVAQPAATPAPISTAPPTFLNKEMPRVGLILGPGGMKAFAHIGVLREFAKARIPVYAVAGLEWGAVIGALYAQAGQANDAEWKAMKLREQDLPGEGGFLSSRSKPQSIGMLNEFLETAFGGAKIESSKELFACPAYWSKVDRFGWMSTGTVKDAMRACLPYPPLFSDNAGVMAAPFAVDEAAAYLRSRGANLIVLVNVLAQGEFLPSKMLGDQLSDNILWSEIRRELMRAKPPVVHYVINVNTSGHPVTDFAGRRALMDVGAKAAADTVNKMVTQYGF
jgi:NTE family protein